MCRSLWNVVKEGLRLHTTSALGLAREIPRGSSCTVQGHHFPERTILSIPSWTMHHDPGIWGPDAMEYRPERFDYLTTEQKKAFNPFSFGPRACSGRNLAEMETLLVVATIFKRYSFECYQEELVTTEGFLHKPLGCSLGIRRR
jgi:benzoate 4-monooxygenase